MAEYGTSVESSAAPEKVWKIWSDMSTWGDWNPNVSTMEWQGGFASGATGGMKTPAGQHPKMKALARVPGPSVVPGTTFRFNCRIVPLNGKSRVSQHVEVKGPLGPILGGMLGPQVSKEFGTLLSNLAKRAEAA